MARLSAPSTIALVYALYSLLFAVALVISVPWWLLEMLRHGKYRTGWSERLGRLPDRLFEQLRSDTIWIHAVSVGEVLAIGELVSQFKAERPGWRVVVSTTTDTGQQLARQKFGEQDVFYAPLDLPLTVRPYLACLRPKLLVLAESEFWPNLLHLARRAGAKIAIVNARVSDRSLPRYLRFRGLLSRVMQDVDLFLAQSEEDARRLVAIGAPAERVRVSGNLKFEVKPRTVPLLVSQLRAAMEREPIGPVIVAGSTLEGEESMLLQMFRAVRSRYQGTTLMLAPRHPERFAEVASLAGSSGLPWTRRSEWDDSKQIAGGVFLLDSIGELASLYQFADLAFVGGSLVPRGGHNVLEAAQFGVPILVGPSTENFRDIVDVFQRAGALLRVTPDSLTATVLALLENYEERVQMGHQARRVMEEQGGATERTLRALFELIPDTTGSRRPELTAERHG